MVGLGGGAQALEAEAIRAARESYQAKSSQSPRGTSRGRARAHPSATPLLVPSRFVFETLQRRMAVLVSSGGSVVSGFSCTKSVSSFTGHGRPVGNAVSLFSCTWQRGEVSK